MHDALPSEKKKPTVRISRKVNHCGHSPCPWVFPGMQEVLKWTFPRERSCNDILQSGCDIAVLAFIIGILQNNILER